MPLIVAHERNGDALLVNAATIRTIEERKPLDPADYRIWD